MTRSIFRRPRKQHLKSGGRYRTPAGNPPHTPFVMDAENGLPDAQHPAIRATHDRACMHDHHGTAIGRSKWKRRDARSERRKDKVVVREAVKVGADDAGPVQPQHTYCKGPRRSEAK